MWFPDPRVSSVPAVVTSTIALRNDTVLVAWDDRKQVPVAQVTVPKGTIVNYAKHTTSKGVYHEVWVYANRVRYDSVVKAN